jgi:hypothetical protein
VKRRNRRRTKTLPKRRRQWRKAAPITHARLLELLEYRADEGRFVWRVDRRGRGKAGDTAGYETPGKGGHVWRISLNGKVYPLRRLAHFYQTGEWPSRQRPPAHGRGVYRRSKPGLARPFAARIRVDGVVRALGTFETEPAALEAVAEARTALLGEAPAA